MVLGFVLSTALMAQKADQLKNSYNYLRAIEILENDGDPNEALDYLQKEVNDMAQIKRGDVVTFSQRGAYAYSANGVFDTMKVESVNGYEPKCLIVSYQYLYLYEGEIMPTTGDYTSVNSRSLPTGETCGVPDYDITITGHIDESEIPSINVE